MATQVPPKRGAAFSFEVSLVSQADTDLFQTSVTLAAGDVVVYKDGVLDGNIDSLPAEIGTSGVLVVALSAAEMTADRVTVRFHDQADDEWQDLLVTLHTVTTSQIDDLATAAALATAQADLDNPDQYKANVAALATSVALATVDANVDAILADTGTDGVVVAAASKTGYALSAAGIDSILDEAVEGAYTMRQLLRLMASALFGKVSGGGTATVTFRDTGDSANRIVATVTTDGDRTSVVLNAA